MDKLDYLRIVAKFCDKYLEIDRREDESYFEFSEEHNGYDINDDVTLKRLDCDELLRTSMRLITEVKTIEKENENLKDEIKYLREAIESHENSTSIYKKYEDLKDEDAIPF
ncbi:hypothetical protein [Terrisporobacter sp.]